MQIYRDGLIAAGVPVHKVVLTEFTEGMIGLTYSILENGIEIDCPATVGAYLSESKTLKDVQRVAIARGVQAYKCGLLSQDLGSVKLIQGLSGLLHEFDKGREQVQPFTERCAPR